MITISNGAALDLYHDLLDSAVGTMPTERAKAPTYRRLAGELKACCGGADYVELTPELDVIARQFGYIG